MTSCLTLRDVRTVAHGAAFAVCLASAIVLTLSGAVAQGAGCASDAEIASALDNFRVAWVASKGLLGAKDASEGAPKAPDSHGMPWERVTVEAHDRVDSLRSGPIGDNEHTELTARIEGPATLRFWWKVDSQEHADFLSFVALPENEVGAADASPQGSATELNISGWREWAEVEVSLPEATGYRVRWSYRKDSSGRSGADAGWVDAVRVEGPGYYKIELDRRKAEDGAVKLSWRTLPCRHYQVWWRPKNGSSLAWQRMIPKVEPATGTEGSLLERPSLSVERDYRVTLEEPPYVIRIPSARKFAEKEGAPLTLAYEAEGSGAIEYTWYFQGADVDRPTRLPAMGDNWKIVSDGRRTSLRFDALTEEYEGEYFLVAENEAGREQVPPVSVEVFQPPRLGGFVVRGEEPESRVEVEDTGKPAPMPELSVNAGQSLEIEPEITGSEPIEVIWEREESGSGLWRPLAEGPDRRLRLDRATPADAGRYRVTLKNHWGKSKGPRVVVVAVNTSPRILCVTANRGDCLDEEERIEVDQLDPLTLTVEVEGTKPLSYQWYRRDNPIPQQQGGTSATVTVATDHAGTYEYQVHVKNSTDKFDLEKFSISISPINDHVVFRDCSGCPQMIVIPVGFVKISSPSLKSIIISLDNVIENKCKRYHLNYSSKCHKISTGRTCTSTPIYSHWTCPLMPNELIYPSLFAPNLNLVKRIAVGVYEVTLGEFETFMTETGYMIGTPCWTYKSSGYIPRTNINWRQPGFNQDDHHSVVCVGWDDANAYATWLSNKTGKVYRLLQEQEWEYVPRANTKTWRYWDNDNLNDEFYFKPFRDKPSPSKPVTIRWIYSKESVKSCAYENGFSETELVRTTADCDDGAAYTAPVGSYLPNAFGLYDVLGNVTEWVAGDCDRSEELYATLSGWRHPFIQGDPPERSSTGDCRQVVRGQSWLFGRFNVAARTKGKGAGYRATYIGFRIARELSSRKAATLVVDEQ